jgi:hypothetical protein
MTPPLGAVSRRSPGCAAGSRERAELPVDGAFDDRRQQTHRPLERSLRRERHARTAIGRGEHPPAIDGLRSLDDVGVKPAGAVELRDLDHLLKRTMSLAARPGL